MLLITVKRRTAKICEIREICVTFRITSVRNISKK